MKILKFLGPTHVLSIDGERIKRGKEAIVSDETAARLKKSRQVAVEVRNLSSPSLGSTPQGTAPPRTGTGGEGSSKSKAAAAAAVEVEEKES
jgi:hypothetical protein